MILEDFNWDNEWADSLHVPAQGGRGCGSDLGLTWQLVDEIVGATTSLQGSTRSGFLLVEGYSETQHYL